MQMYVAKKSCFWGPQPGAESFILRGTVILAHGTEPQIDEFFELAEAAPPVSTSVEIPAEEKAPKRRAPKAVVDVG